MSLRINTNVAALNSYNNLNANQAKLEGAFQQLSSGLRINKAADDAAGLSIAQGLTSQINGLTQAVSNANDGINVAQIADGALGTTQDILQRMRGLVVKAGNVGTQDSKSLGAIQQEITNLNTQLDNIAGQTKFGQTNLLDGTYNKNFQVGANGNDTISLDLSGAGVKSDNVANTGVDLSKLNVVNGIKPQNIEEFTLAANGGATQNSTPAVLSAGQQATVAGLFGNNQAGTPAAYDKVDKVGGTAGATTIFIGAQNADGAWDVTDSTTGRSLGQITFNDSTGAYTVTDANGNALGAINSAYQDTAFQTSTLDSTVKVDNTTALGKALTAAGFTANANVTFTKTASGWDLSDGTVSGNMTVDQGVYKITSGAAPTQAKTGYFDTNATPNSVTGVLSNYSSANATNDLSQIDKAIDGISKARSGIGAVQNQLGYTVSNLQTAITNVTASRSNLTDADLAQQVTAMTQSQILTQAATSVLAQANSAPQAILKLLQ